MRRTKPKAIKDAEKERKELNETKRVHLNTMTEQKKKRDLIKNDIAKCDDNKPEKLKKEQKTSSLMPQDEDELNRMVSYWENVLHTKTLKPKE